MEKTYKYIYIFNVYCILIYYYSYIYSYHAGYLFFWGRRWKMFLYSYYIDVIKLWWCVRVCVVTQRRSERRKNRCVVFSRQKIRFETWDRCCVVVGFLLPAAHNIMTDDTFSSVINNTFLGTFGQFPPPKKRHI